MNYTHIVYHGSEGTPTIQASLEVFVLLIFSRPCKRLFGYNAQVGSHIEVGN